MSAPQTANRATQLRRASRKVDRVNQVLAAIANGQSLLASYRPTPRIFPTCPAKSGDIDDREHAP